MRMEQPANAWCTVSGHYYDPTEGPPGASRRVRHTFAVGTFLTKGPIKGQPDSVEDTTGPSSLFK
jgi:hypothetical protein